VRNARFVDDAERAGAELIPEDERPGRVGRRRQDESGRSHRESFLRPLLPRDEREGLERWARRGFRARVRDDEAVGASERLAEAA
jgi:hypothetical protein